MNRYLFCSPMSPGLRPVEHPCGPGSGMAELHQGILVNPQRSSASVGRGDNTQSSPALRRAEAFLLMTGIETSFPGAQSYPEDVRSFERVPCAHLSTQSAPNIIEDFRGLRNWCGDRDSAAHCGNCERASLPEAVCFTSMEMNAARLNVPNQDCALSSIWRHDGCAYCHHEDIARRGSTGCKSLMILGPTQLRPQMCGRSSLTAVLATRLPTSIPGCPIEPTGWGILLATQESLGGRARPRR